MRPMESCWINAACSSLMRWPLCEMDSRRLSECGEETCGFRRLLLELLRFS